ncbi:MAG: hypothetical protein AAGG47_22635 [Pseudomonadota bacterium]
MPPSDPPRVETPPERRKLDLAPLHDLLLSLYRNVGDFEMVLKLGLGRNLADIAPETLPERLRYLKALEAFDAQGSLLDLRQALLDQNELESRREYIDRAFDSVLGPPPPKNFNDREAVERWFDSHDPDIAVVCAARAALRVAPLLASDDVGEAPSVLILPSLRAIAAPWLAGTWPSKHANISAAADAAARAAYAADHDAAAVAAAAAATDAAAFAAFSADTSDGLAVPAAADACVAAYSTGYTAVPENVDAAALREGYGAAALMRRSLWADGEMPDALAEAWSALKARLLAREGEHWEVWTEWYEARLRGDPGNPNLEYERVTSPEIDWDAGPATVNAKIKEIIERHSRITSPARDDPTDERSTAEELEALLRSPQLRVALVDYTLDKLAKLIRVRPFTNESAATEDTAAAQERETMLAEIAELITDLIADLRSRSNVEKELVIELERYALEAKARSQPVRAGRLWDLGLSLNDFVEDEDVEFGLNKRHFSKLERVVDKHTGLMQAYFASELARLRYASRITVADDAEPVRAIEALELAVDGIEQLTLDEIRADDEVAAVTEDQIRALRSTLRRLERAQRSSDAGAEQEQRARFWEHAKPALIGVVRLKLRVLQEAPTVIGGLAGVETLLPGALQQAVEMVEELLGNLPEL